jgi:hypothetical protein
LSIVGSSTEGCTSMRVKEKEIFKENLQLPK